MLSNQVECLIKKARAVTDARMAFHNALLEWKKAHEGQSTILADEDFDRMEEAIQDAALEVIGAERDLLHRLQRAAEYEARNTKAPTKADEEPGPIDLHTELPLSDLKVPGYKMPKPRRPHPLGKASHRFATELLKFKLKDGEVFEVDRVVNIRPAPNNTKYAATSMLKTLAARGLIKKVGVGTWSVPSRANLREALKW